MVTGRTRHEDRPVRQTLHIRRPHGRFRWHTYWYRTADAVADLNAHLAADPEVRWGYVASADPPFLYRARTGHR